MGLWLKAVVEINRLTALKTNIDANTYWDLTDTSVCRYYLLQIYQYQCVYSLILLI